jgi:hypothetical protein
MEGQPIKHVDLWNNQLRYIAEEAPFATPAVFVEFLPISWKQVSDNTYGADVEFKLHIVTDSRVDKWRDAISALELTGEILRTLHLATNGGFVLKSSVTDSLFDELMDNVDTYTSYVVFSATEEKF